MKRKSNTTSIAGAVDPERMGALRGFLVRPTKLNFGILREGHTYGVSLTLKNIGLDNCRFRIKAPPPSTGLTVKFSPPGAVAPGMSHQIQLELFALANPKDTSEDSQKDSSELSNLLHQLQITTEVEIFSLPVIAQVLPANEYDSKYSPADTGVHGHSHLAYILSTQPVAPQNPLKRSNTNLVK